MVDQGSLCIKGFVILSVSLSGFSQSQYQILADISDSSDLLSFSKSSSSTRSSRSIAPQVEAQYNKTKYYDTKSTMVLKIPGH